MSGNKTLRQRLLHESLDPSPERRGRLECSHGNRGSLSPFRGAGGVAGGDAGLQAVWALQAEGVVRLAATRWRLMMQDGVMDCGRQICVHGRESRDSCQRLIPPSVDGFRSLLVVFTVRSLLNHVASGELIHMEPPPCSRINALLCRRWPVYSYWMHTKWKPPMC